MTRDRDFKTKVRARMAKTGERYTAARAHLAAPPAAIAGVHPETTALRRVALAAGVPATEALLLGLGGGLGFGYFVFEYKGHAPTFYLATRCQPQYAYGKGFVDAAATRLGLVLDYVETTSKAAAAKHLRERVARGPVIAWVGRDAHMGAMPHVVVVTAIDGDHATLDDLDAAPLRVDLATLAAWRARLPKEKHRLASVAGTREVDRAAAVGDAIAACAAELAGATRHKAMAKSFGLGALTRWADLLEDPRDKKGWPKVFAGAEPFAAALRWGHHWIEEAGTGGGAFRRLYAAFLDEAAAITGARDLRDAAASYRDLADRWTALARTMRAAADAPEDAAAIRADLAARIRAIAEREETALRALRKPIAAGSARR